MHALGKATAFGSRTAWLRLLMNTVELAKTHSFLKPTGERVLMKKVRPEPSELHPRHRQGVVRERLRIRSVDARLAGEGVEEVAHECFLQAFGDQHHSRPAIGRVGQAASRSGA